MKIVFELIAIGKVASAGITIEMNECLFGQPFELAALYMYNKKGIDKDWTITAGVIYDRETAVAQLYPEINIKLGLDEDDVITIGQLVNNATGETLGEYTVMNKNNCTTVNMWGFDE